MKRDDFRKARNYYLALASEIARPALGALGALSTGRPTPRDRWRKGLIISHTHIGDVLYRTPSLPHLTRAMPGCEWHYLVAPESAPVLHDNPSISRVLPLVRGEDSWKLASGGFAELRAERYDVALCSNSIRHFPDLALATALGIPNRVGFAHRGLSGLLTHPIIIDRPLPFPAYFREMVKQLCELDYEWNLEPRISISVADRAPADEFLARVEPNGHPLVACCPTTRQPEGSWPDKIFTDALNVASTKRPISIVLCGTDADRERLERCGARLTARCRIMAGELDLTAFAALLSKCDLIFSQDSAARHLGNAVGRPVSFFRNLAVVAVESGPYCASEEDLAPPNGAVAESQMSSVRARVSAESVARRLAARLTR